MTHLSEEDLILIYYGESDIPAHARAHLRDCADCRAAADSLAGTLDLCNGWTVPQPAPEFERSVWAQVAPRLETRRREGMLLAGLLRPRLWAIAIAMAVLILVAFLAGRNSRSAARPIVAGLSQQARERILAISIADHLDRAGMLLTEISNADDSAAADLSADRGRAQDLVEEGRLMRQTLAAQGDTSTLNFLDEVERFMLEIANAPDTLTPAEVRDLQQRIGSGSLLFKVRIIESNLRTEGQKL